MVNRITAPVAGGPLPPSPEAEFTAWVSAALTRRGPPTELELRVAASGFAAAAADSTYLQAKNALVQTLSYFEQGRPEMSAPLLEALKPWFRALAQTLPLADAKRELAELESGRFTVQVSLPVPASVLEEIRQVQASEAWRAFTALGGSIANREATPRRSGGSRSLVETLRLQASAPPPGLPSGAQWGAFLGRAISGGIDRRGAELLDLLVARGRYDRDLAQVVSFAGVAGGEVRANRLSAALELAQRAATGASKLNALDKSVLAELAKQKPNPTLDYVPLTSIKDGDFEAALYKYASTEMPSLRAPLLLYHPHIPTTDQLPAVVEQLDAIAEESGKCLAGFNVMTVMHQMGRTVPWLSLLEEKLGLNRENYLGVSVPYSGSEIAIDRLNLEGFRTLDDHDPRDPLLAKLEDTIGAGNPQGFDELKTAAIRRAVEEMLDKHAENGLPIMVIDDGGYVSKVVRAHFKDDESKFRFVEWTTRGVRQFETIADPAYALVSAAECQPKSYFEPPFIAKAAVEHLLVGAGTRFSSLKDLEVATIGHGSIGRAAALALAGEGAAVQVSDLDAKHRARAAEDGLAQTADVKQAVAGKKLVVAATGANSSPPPVFEASAPGTVWASLSSVDIETRDDKDPRNNGTWGTNLVRANLKAELDPTAPGGVKVELEAREILNGGYPLNLSRRVRVMPLEEEEVILLVLNEAIAQATQEKGTGKKQVAPEREDRIDRLYRQYHPEQAAYVDAFWKP